MIPKTVRVVKSGPTGGFIVQELETFSVKGKDLSLDEAKKLAESIVSRNQRLGIKTDVVYV